MIFNGSKGSLVLFYNNLLIGSYPLSNKKSYESYKYQGEHLILKTIEKIPIKLQIKTYRSFCEMIYEKKKNKLGIHRTYYEMFLCCIFALIKLKQLEEDDCIFIAPRKKLLKKQNI
tara:strand:- start:187 stop:534 length:348 start_codon:yes stop_codon:yes gene_type:complete